MNNEEKILRNEKIKELQTHYQSLMEEGILDRGGLEAVSTWAIKQYNYTQRIDEDYQEGEYMGLHEQLCAYTAILDNKEITVAEALAYMADNFDKPDEFIDAVKNKKFYFAKRVVQKADSHPQQQLMLKNGTMDRNALSSSKTPNQQLRKLVKYKKVSDQLESLKQTDIAQQKEIENLQVNDKVQDSKLDIVLDKLGIPSVTLKEKVLLLHQHHYSPTQISNHLPVSKSTVQRWIKQHSK